MGRKKLKIIYFNLGENEGHVLKGTVVKETKANIELKNIRELSIKEETTEVVYKIPLIGEITSNKVRDVPYFYEYGIRTLKIKKKNINILDEFNFDFIEEKKRKVIKWIQNK